jgi:hypothetical protein
VNLFKPSAREGSRGVVLSFLLDTFGISVYKSTEISQVVCNPCARKIRLLYTTHDFVKKGLEGVSGQETIKRKSIEVISPERRSPARKTAKRSLAISRKSLNFNNVANKENLDVANALNINDLTCTETSDLKVVISYPNGNVVVKSALDLDSKTVIRDIALSKWKSAINAIFKHKFLHPELHLKLECEVEREIKDYCKSESILKRTEPDQLAAFSNRILCSEIEIHCPLYNTVMKSVCMKKVATLLLSPPSQSLLLLPSPSSSLLLPSPLRPNPLPGPSPAPSPLAP